MTESIRTPAPATPTVKYIRKGKGPIHSRAKESQAQRDAYSDPFSSSFAAWVALRRLKNARGEMDKGLGI